MRLPAAPTPAEEARARAQALAEVERRKRAGVWSGGAVAHTAYQKRPVEWIVEKLGVAEETLRWSVLPEYASHEWDGTKDPLVDALEAISRGESLAVSSGTATGKAAWVESHVLTPTGWRRMGDVRVGDAVIGKNGQPVEVLGVYPQGVRSLYRVTFSDGAEAIVDAEHLWNVRTRGQKHRGLAWRTHTTAEVGHRIARRWEVPVMDAAQLPEAILPLDPYVLGILLGDGHFNVRASLLGLSTGDAWVVAEVLRLTGGVLQRRTPCDYLLRDNQRTFDSLQALGLIGKRSWDKSVPAPYLLASAEQRLSLLQGLMDSDGTVDAHAGTSFTFTSASAALARDVRALVLSLGGIAKCRIKKTLPTYHYKGEKRTGRPCHQVQIQLPNEVNPFRLPRKANRVRPRTVYGLPRRYIEAVEFAFNGEAQCIKVAAADQLYVMDDFVVTHNTFSLGACGSLWYLACFERSIVLSIAPKAEQLLLNMWKEIGSLFPRFKRHFPEATLLTGKLRMLGGEGEQEVWAATAFSAGVGAQEDIAQRLAGFHHPRMLWLVEDAPGVDPALMNTIINTATGQFNPILAMGNPDHRYDTLGLFSARPWVRAIRISALDYPNVVTGRAIVPGAVTAESIARRLADADGNEDDPIYLSRVRGVAPAESRRALIRWAWCEAATKRMDDPELRKGPLALGVDVADKPTGDKSAFSRWQGAVCTEVVSFSAEDASEVGRMVYAEVTDASHPINPRHVGIDSVGVGASTVNELKRLGVRVRNLSGGTRAVPTIDAEARWAERTETDDGRLLPIGPVIPEVERYANLRSQVFWRLREDLRLGRIAIPDDKKLFQELTAIQYEEPSGRITVEPKDGIRARLGHSPDRADALAYGCWVRARAPLREPKGAEQQPTRERNRDLGLEALLSRHQRQADTEDRRIRRLFGHRQRRIP